MKVLAVLAFLGISLAAQAQDKPQPEFRKPFTLHLGVDETHSYSQDFDKVPYVLDGDVYLFVGESFGVRIVARDGEMSEVVYEPDAAKCDVCFRFSQEKADQGFMMMLTTKNNLKRTVEFDALMTVPGKDGIFKTTIVPVPPSLSSFESWPHPIVQLVLRNFRFQKPGEAGSK